LHVHAPIADFVFRRASAVSASPVSAQNICIFCCIPQNAAPLGFCCGGFSSTAGYVPGNEAHAFAMSGIATRLVVPFQRVLLVFIRTTRKVLRPFLASLSASTQGVNSNCFPRSVALKQCVTAFVRLSLCRSNARKQF